MGGERASEESEGQEWELSVMNKNSHALHRAVC